MNAADRYRQAFAYLPEQDFHAYHGYLNRDDPEVERLVERGRDALDMLDRAARCETCDWGPEAVLSIPLDVFSSARCLAVLAMLRAQASFGRGDDRAGLDDLFAITALARHIGHGKYTSGMAGFAIEHVAVTKAFEVLGRLDSETRRAFAEQLDLLPAFPDLADALRAEQTYFRTMYRDEFAELDDRDLVKTIREKFGMPGPTEENAGMLEFVFPAGDPAERMLNASGGTSAGLLALAEETLAAMDALVEAANGSDRALSEKLSALRDAASSNPLLADQLRTFDSMRPIWDRYREQFARLRSRVDGG
jgi:hypothetical protein